MHVLIIIVVFLSAHRGSPLTPNSNFPNCTTPLNCGDLRNLTYPFSGGPRPPYCGLPKFELTCLTDAQGASSALLNSNSLMFRVNRINQSNRTLVLSRLDLYNTTCSPASANTSLDASSFLVSPTNANLTLLYGCTGVSDRERNLTTSFSCGDGGVRDVYYYVGSTSTSGEYRSCNFSISVPVRGDRAADLLAARASLGDVLRDGFEVEYVDKYSDKCDACRRRVNGTCGFDLAEGKPLCLCNDHICPGKSSKNIAVPIGVSAAAAAMIVVFFIGYYVSYVRIRTTETLPSFSVNINNNNRNPKNIPSEAEAENSTTFYGVQIFTTWELEKATGNFDSSKVIGSGGYGTVYYGVLGDGREVAVKRLFDNGVKREEQFMNEVEILNKLTHRNLVRLYGCTSRRIKDLTLVYEYVPNKTVAYHLLNSASVHLPWAVRFSIAVETAEALAYLHANDVIHRDVKTTNILLDNEFRVKMADFGMSRLFPRDATHVTTAPQGTPGYVDPEYYYTYKVTEKSDVYSFGVVLVELLSSLPAVDTSRHRLEVNLATMAMSKIKCQKICGLVDKGLGFDKDEGVRRMVTGVAELAFNCLQENREARPVMAAVCQELKRIEAEGIS